MPVIYGRRCYSFTVPAATWEGLFPGGANPETLWFTANGEGGLCRVDSITRNETEVSVSLTQVPTLAEAFDCPDYPAAPPHLHGGFLESLRERDAIAFDLD